jgi:hypothetical protein
MSEATWAVAWAVYEKLKRRWAAKGYEPRRRPAFRWNARHGATLRTTTVRIVKFRISPVSQTRTAPGQGVSPSPRQPNHARLTWIMRG